MEDAIFFVFIGKALCRGKFPWDGKYVKEKQPHLEEILASPWFRLANNSSFYFPEKWVSQLKT